MPGPASTAQAHHLPTAPLLLLLGCAHPAEPAGPDRADLAELGDRAGRVLAEDPWGDGATRLRYLDQGWSVPQTLWYYFADQGSMLLPYDMFLHLEQPDAQAPLLDPANLVRFRLLPQLATPNNPDALPVGWTRHEGSVGLTCAACHTGQLTYQGTAVRIDGAPAVGDIFGFILQIHESITATLADEARFERYVAARWGDNPSAAEREEARQELSTTKAWFDGYVQANASTTVEGYGRMDAIGRIINQVIRFTSDVSNSAEPNAPTNFPVLWDAPRHDYVQWVGFAPNAKVGSLGRNVGEVLGTFGTVEVQHYDNARSARAGYPSSVQAGALAAMEETLWDLQSPVWPEDLLPPIDRAQAARGATLYQEHCVSCHAVIVRDDPERRVTAMITGIDVVGTDPQSALNLATAEAPTGVLEGSLIPDSETRYGPTAPALNLLGNLVRGVLTAQPAAAVRVTAYAQRYGLEETPKQGNYTPSSEADPRAALRSYKARPLNGCWASAPYLHNGSVPTLYDLLLPVAERPARFAVGRWAYDPVRVGYVSEGELPWVLDTSVTGNHNTGHEYGTTLPDADRWALVEYLKTL